MKEFMLLIRNESNSKSGFNSEKEESFLNSCKTYIEKLTVEGRLISAQPLIREGAMLSNPKDPGKKMFSVKARKSLSGTITYLQKI